MKILLIRHGRTTGDDEDRYGGWYDDDLTSEGKNQLAFTAEYLINSGIEKLFASTLKRAQQSASIINEVIKVVQENRDDLRERNYGILGGLTKTEAMEKFPEAVEAHKDPSNTDPKGESQADFTNRILSAFNDIAARPHSIAAIVAHGGTIKTILRHLKLPLPDSIGDGEIIEVNV